MLRDNDILDSACNYVVNSVCERMVNQYVAETIPSRKKPLLDVLVGLLRSHRLVYEVNSSTSKAALESSLDAMEGRRSLRLKTPATAVAASS